MSELRLSSHVSSSSTAHGRDIPSSPEHQWEVPSSPEQDLNEQLVLCVKKSNVAKLRELLGPIQVDVHADDEDEEFISSASPSLPPSLYAGNAEEEDNNKEEDRKSAQECFSAAHNPPPGLFAEHLKEEENQQQQETGPMHWAAYSSNVECFKALRMSNKHGFNMTQKTQFGTTPLMLGCIDGGETMFTEFQETKEFRQAVDAVNALGESALCISAYHGNLSACRLLLKSNASTAIQTKYTKQTALMIALLNKKNEAALLILAESNATDLLHQIDTNGYTIQDYATANGDETILAALNDKLSA